MHFTGLSTDKVFHITPKDKVYPTRRQSLQLQSVSGTSQ